MARHNLSTVISFEVTRTLTKKRFWISTLVVPLVIGIVIALVVLANASTSDRVDAQKDAKFTFTYSDPSGYVDPAIVKKMGGSKALNPEQAIAAVKAGAQDAYFAYSEDPATGPTKVYGVDLGIFENAKYDTIATQILVSSAQKKIGDDTLTTLAQGDLATESVTYKDGQVSGGINSVIPPLLFLVILYVVIGLLGNQMLNSTLEEKENRVTEMILTTMNPTTLILGKIVAMFVIGLVQVLVFLLPAILGFLFFRDSLNVPNFDLSTLVINPGPMIVGALLLIGGFTLFTATLVAVGAIMPTAKDAGQIFGVIMILMFVPLYAVSLIVSDPHAFIVQIFTYFPYSAPVTGLLRNGFGSLTPLESAIIIVEQFVLGVVVLRLAVQLFRYGSIEYTKKVSLRTVFGRRV